MDTQPSTVGAVTPKPAQGAKPTGKPAVDASGKSSPELEHLRMRRRLIWVATGGFLVTNLLMFLRFFFPRTLFEPSLKFRIGSPSDFGLGVDERFKQSHRIWVVRLPDKLFVIVAKCTHLGCTPNWIETENKFKCPCHGSGYDMEGRNFEGPAPRPMDRAEVELDAEGQIVVDTSRLYQCPAGGKCEFDTDPNSYLAMS
ncbi:MAG TPA: ubiquinol-cytochrome c reductase iron-sulfur subunit [Bryobacteraceae bacterium]|nr:ubiquinol-cytochrome c reductase iron-sulfur subunit [Bryobacteraceae bacterium]